MRLKGAVVAVIKNKLQSLKALTATALSLPGMMAQPAFAAEGDEVDFQYSHYQEGKRDISVYYFDQNTGTESIQGSKSYNPIEVEGIHGSAKISLTDRIKFAFNYTQDTWGGATPVATTPYLATGNSQYKVGAVAGASPYATSGAALDKHYVDSRSKALFATEEFDPNTGLPIYKTDTQLTHVMAMASPEVRKQGDFKLSYDWDNAGLSVGGGISVEDDYESRFGNIGGRFDFNQKQTVLNVDLSYTNSDTNAVLDHDDYTLKTLMPENQYTNPKQDELSRGIIHGTRQDWATHLGLSQVLNKDIIISADFNYTRSTGYLSNPYKGVAIAFADFNYDPNQLITPLPDGVFPARINFFTEQRPEVRNQYGLGGHYVQYINPLDAALHFNYNFSDDDWGIQSHAFDADLVQPLGNGWSITPRIRYYSQDAASFYSPYIITPQAKTTLIKNGIDDNYVYTGSDGKDYSWRNDPATGAPIMDTNGLPVYFDAQGNPAPPSVIISDAIKAVSFDPNKLPKNYSSDHRLSGFGSLSGGVTISKQFAKGLTLETGFEYYTHQGSLKIGGGGEASYADFDYWLANAAIKVNLDALTLNHGDPEHAGHHGNHHHAAHAPAGIMFDHMLPAGGFMVGYRYMWNSQSGGMLNGSSSIDDVTLKTNGCAGDPCYLTPSNMTMSMHMMDLMYAPTDWLTLMLMPQFVDMHMDMRPIDGQSAADVQNAGAAAPHFIHHSQNPHETGGIGDLGMYALFKVFDNGTHHLHTTAGLSAPTGDVNIQMRRTHQTEGGFMDYGMQLGSGTWDFKPSVTYTGHSKELSWGVQANGVIRMEDKNDSGYLLGDLFQATAWGSYNLTNWLTASLRGAYTVQGSVAGQYNGSNNGQFIDHTEVDLNGSETTFYSSILKFGPQDYPGNYGGRFWDVGFGLSALVPGDNILGGNRLSVEWLQPVHTDFNGYQLDRDGALSATWSVMF